MTMATTSLLTPLPVPSAQSNAASATGKESDDVILLSAISNLLGGLEILNLLWNQKGQATSITLAVELVQPEVEHPATEAHGQTGPPTGCQESAEVAADSALTPRSEGTDILCVAEGSDAVLVAEERAGKRSGNSGEDNKSPAATKCVAVKGTRKISDAGAAAKANEVQQGGSGEQRTSPLSGWEEAQAVVREGRIGPVGMTAIASALEQGGGAGLESLHLGSNDIGDMGIAALAGALERGGGAKIKFLYLEDNGIGDPGAAALAWSLERGGGKALEIMHLGYNKIGDPGAVALAWALKRGGGRRIHTLDLAYNRIGDIGAAALGGALDRGWGGVKGLEMLELQAVVTPEGLRVEGPTGQLRLLTASADNISDDGRVLEEDANNECANGLDVSSATGGDTKMEGRDEGSPRASVVVKYMLVQNNSQSVRDVFT